MLINGESAWLLGYRQVGATHYIHPWEELLFDVQGQRAAEGNQATAAGYFDLGVKRTLDQNGTVGAGQTDLTFNLGIAISHIYRLIHPIGSR